MNAGWVPKTRLPTWVVMHKHPPSAALTILIGFVVFDHNVGWIETVFFTSSFDINVVRTQVRALHLTGRQLLDGCSGVDEVEQLGNAMQWTLILTTLVADGDKVAPHRIPALLLCELTWSSFNIQQLVSCKVVITLAVDILLETVSEEVKDFRWPLVHRLLGVGAILLLGLVASLGTLRRGSCRFSHDEG